MDIQTRSASAADKWGVKVSMPTFTDGTLDEGSAKVTLTLPKNRTNYKALLRVSIIDNKGQEFSVNRIVWFKADEDANVIDNTTGDLASKITTPASVKQLSVIGTVSDDDFAFIRENMTSIEVLDLSRATIAELPLRAMAFYSSMGLSDNTSLTTVILPETLIEIGQSAFAMCTALKEMNIPTSMRSIGSWAFEECQSLAQLTLPDELTELSHDAFYSCGIKNINIPLGVTVLNDGLFAYCSNLETVTLHDNITSIGNDVFSICKNLLPKKFVLPSKVTSVGARAFTYTGLTSVKIPEGVTCIGHSAFNNCTIKAVDIPSTVTSLASTAFYWKEADVVICRSLTVPTIDEEDPDPSGGSNHYDPFYQIKSACILKKPAEADYSAWNSYFNRIQNL